MSSYALAHPAAVRVLGALSAPSDDRSLAVVLPAIYSAIRSAASRWPDQPIEAWLQCTEHLLRKVEVDADADQRRAAVLHGEFDRDQPHTYCKLTKWREPMPADHDGERLNALLGKAVCIAAGQQRHVSTTFVDGLSTLRKLQRSGRGYRDWVKVADAVAVGVPAARALFETLPAKSTARHFLIEVVVVLEARCEPFVDRTDVCLPPSGVEIAAETARTVQGGHGQAQASLSFEAEADKDEGPKLSIPARLSAADYAPAAMKLGLHHRDHLLAGDLALITTKLAQALDNTDALAAALSAGALLALLSGAGAEVLSLPLQRRDELDFWIEPIRGTLAWDFSRFRQHLDLTSACRAVEPVHVPLPAPLANYIRTNCDLHRTSTDLGQLLAATTQRAILVEDIRRWVKKLGGTTHPALLGRFSRSLYPVWLEQSGSDMLASVACARFEGVAPAALYYYNPPSQLLYRQSAIVYKYLGLNSAADQVICDARVTRTQILEPDTARTGWQSLLAIIDTARSDAMSAHSTNEFYESAFRWMRGLCAALVLQSAHRGTRLDRLSFGALFGHPDFLLIHDKDDERQLHPRLVPKTVPIQSILDSAAECWSLRYRHLEIGKPPPPPDQDAAVFVRWTGDLERPSPIRTEDIAMLIAECFKGWVNIGRATWVTSLDEDGCDRWLIRSLTGHARDVTKANGAYMDVPPAEAAKRLGASMVKTGERLFGTDNVARAHGKPPAWQRRLTASPSTPPAQDPVPDPRTLLDPITPETLAGWTLITVLRHQLLAGRVVGSLQTVTALQLICIDAHPAPDACLAAVIDTQQVARLGRSIGVSWSRPHFVHPFWIPAQPATALLLQRLQAEPFKLTRTQVLAEIAELLRQCAVVSTPSDNESAWRQLCTASLAWRRLELPPTLTAISLTSVPAPTLSQHSLRRLAGEPTPMSSSNRPARERRIAGGVPDEMLAIRSVLNKHADSGKRIGERRQRSKLALAQIRAIAAPSTAASEFFRDWITEEVERAYRGDKGSYALSTLATYGAEFSMHLSSLPEASPYDWEESDWQSFLDLAKDATAAARGPDPLQVLRHALAALARSLVRRQLPPPALVFRWAGEPAPVVPRGSASASLVTPTSLRDAQELVKSWHEESPIAGLLVEAKALVSGAHPVRPGELSSLQRDCVTDANGLVLKRVGFALHKNDNATRVVPMAPLTAARLRAIAQHILVHTGPVPLLTRTDGGPKGVELDRELNDDWNTALKIVTGDLNTRPYSVRASALQERAWPGWHVLAAEQLLGRLATRDCAAWQLERHADWIATARAMSEAGQGDLRSAFGYYLAAWPLVYSAHVRAGLATIRPKPGFVEQIGLRSDAMRKARSRAQISHSEFCAWDWIAAAVVRKADEAAQERRSLTIHQTACEAHGQKQPGRPTSNDGRQRATDRLTEPGTMSKESTVRTRLRFLVIRTLGLGFDRAVYQLKLSRSEAVELDSLVPSEQLREAVMARRRSSPSTRGVDAQIKMALTAQGDDLIEWISSLRAIDIAALHALLFRLDAHVLLADDWHHQLVRLASTLPNCISMRVRVGTKYFGGAIRATLQSVGESLVPIADSSIGQRPRLLLTRRGDTNDVAAARLTTIGRAACLAVAALRAHIDMELTS